MNETITIFCIGVFLTIIFNPLNKIKSKPLKFINFVVWIFISVIFGLWSGIFFHNSILPEYQTITVFIAQDVMEITGIAWLGVILRFAIQKLVNLTKVLVEMRR